jgi:mono/diheme cytochrome c family protein
MIYGSLQNVTQRHNLTWGIGAAVLFSAYGCVITGGESHSDNAVKLAAERGPMSGQELYEANCAACHAVDGKGRTVAEVGFDYPLPDFTDCNYATPERTYDWVAIAHEGGPIRGFTAIMPAFGDALTTAELTKIIEHVHSLCTDPNWPRGEMNFPLPLYTEKAFPEYESVIKTFIDKDGATETKLIYAQRIGARNQFEVVLPYVNLNTGVPNRWKNGFGDMAVAYKRVLSHSLEKGYILSAVAELGLPTGNKDTGIGSGHATFESFLAGGKTLPKDYFVQSRLIYVMPLDGSDREVGLQTAFGRTISVGSLYGRQISPMIELLGTRTLAKGEKIVWDWAPQMQVTLNQRQHLRVGFGVKLPLTERAGRDPQYGFYFLWDMAEGGLLDGWKAP